MNKDFRSSSLSTSLDKINLVNADSCALMKILLELPLNTIFKNTAVVMIISKQKNLLPGFNVFNRVNENMSLYKYP